MLQKNSLHQICAGPQGLRISQFHCDDSPYSPTPVHFQQINNTLVQVLLTYICELEVPDIVCPNPVALGGGHREAPSCFIRLVQLVQPVLLTFTLQPSVEGRGGDGRGWEGMGEGSIGGK